MFPSVVSEIMNKIVSIDAQSYICEAAKIMVEKKIGSIIVTKNGDPAGIITKSDLIRRVIVPYKDPKTTLVEEVMSTSLISVDLDTPILDAMRFIRDKNISQVLVKKEDKFVGIVAEGDMVTAVITASLAQFSSLLRKQ